jgi:hypothetical protein
MMAPRHRSCQKPILRSAASSCGLSGARILLIGALHCLPPKNTKRFRFDQATICEFFLWFKLHIEKLAFWAHFSCEDALMPVQQMAVLDARASRRTPTFSIVAKWRLKALRIRKPQQGVQGGRLGR